MEHKTGDPPACKEEPYDQVEEHAISPIESREVMALRVILQLNGFQVKPFRIRIPGLSPIFSVLSPVEIMVLRVLVWNSTLLECCPLRIHYLILSSLFSISIVVKMLMVMLVRLVQRWIVVCNYVMLGRKVVAFSGSCDIQIIYPAGSHDLLGFESANSTKISIAADKGTTLKE